MHLRDVHTLQLVTTLRKRFEDPDRSSAGTCDPIVDAIDELSAETHGHTISVH